MGPNDYLLLGADRIKDPALLEQAYSDSQGLTAQFILNVFCHINDLLGSNFDLAKMRYQARFNSEWQQIEMYAIAAQRHRVSFPTVETSFDWQQGEKILVEISRKFDPQRLQEQLRFFDLLPIEHFTDPNESFSVLLFRKQG
jgi:L-histidine Nalpha-methyltransferase